MMRSVPTPAVGTLLGAYRVEGLLGSGSMGEVFRGVDVGLNRRVAIKILSEKHRDSAELRARFVREGRAVAAVSHPNVVQVFATGTYDERPYIAMEFLDGTDLGSLVEKQGALDSRTVVRAAFDAASGLEAASKAGLIHRDVKPSNLVRLTDGMVKVTDFGLAKPVDPGTEPALTAMGVVVGTPDYIAPEQARGEPIDERVDIYALGGSLFFMLVGMPPFRTGKPGEDKYLKVVARHLRQPAPSASERNAMVDPALSQLVQQMMAKRREERPGYPELLAQLTECAARLDPSGESLGRALGSSIASISRAPARSAVQSMVQSMPPSLAPAAPSMAPLMSPSMAPSMSPQVIPAGPGAPTLPVAGLAAPPGMSPAMAPGQAPPAASAWAPGAPQVSSYAEDDAGLSRLPPPAIPRWAIAVTLGSLALFISGLVVYLGRDTEAAPPAAPAPIPAVSVDAPPAPADAPPAAPEPPPGMVAVNDRDTGKLLFWVDSRPVTAEAFRSVFADHKQRDDLPEVVSVSYTRARSYATTVKARLLTSAEWEKASTTPGVIVVDKLSEWVEGENGKRVARNHEAATARDDKPFPNVTFRLVRDVAPP